jgi:hypothetical protein
MMHTRLLKSPAGRLPVVFALITVPLFVAACNRSEKTTSEKVAQRTFSSPEEAGTAFLDATKSGEQSDLLAIFGAEGKDVLFSGDAVKDKHNLQDFVAGYSQMHRWVTIKAGGEMLQIGADNYPFPIPLDQNSSGQWYFDTAAGADEVLARRIGKGELTAMAACDAIAKAQAQYFGQTHDGDKAKQYAQKFASDEGKHNGLYWPAQEGQPPSPLGPLGDFAKALGYSNAEARPQPFDGYYFRMLTKQGDKAQGAAKDYIADGRMTGGFAVVAYPTEYRNSGIMTFMIGTNGTLYQKDLGEETDKVAAAMTEYDPGDGWSALVGTEEIGQ